MKTSHLIILILFFSNYSSAQKTSGLIDANATKETKALYKNLKELAEKHILFGHQHATEYGHGWYGDENKSDVKSVTGSHPAVIGVDFSGLSGRPDAEIQKTKKELQKNIADTYDRGGVTTVSWHFINPASGGGFYWVDTISKPSVKLIIPGGSHHDVYKNILRTVASIANSKK
jgi:mannan endo-1,4-beta-mannosidase